MFSSLCEPFVMITCTVFVFWFALIQGRDYSLSTSIWSNRSVLYCNYSMHIQFKLLLIFQIQEHEFSHGIYLTVSQLVFSYVDITL